MRNRIGTIIILVLLQGLARAEAPTLPETPLLSATATIAERRAYLETERIRLQRAGSNSMEWVDGGLIIGSVGGGVAIISLVGLLMDTPSSGTLTMLQVGGYTALTGYLVASIAFAINVTEGIQLAVVDQKLRSLTVEEEKVRTLAVAALPPAPPRAPAAAAKAAGDAARASGEPEVPQAVKELRAVRWRMYTDRMDGADSWRTVGYIGMGAGATVAAYNYLYFRPSHDPYEPARSYATYHAVMWSCVGAAAVGSVIAYAGDRSYDRLYLERQKTQLTLAPALVPAGGTAAPGVVLAARF